MTGDPRHIRDFEPVTPFVTFASGATLMAKGRGKVTILNAGNNIELDVVYVEGLTKKLISLSKLMKTGFTFECTPDFASLMRGRKVIFTAKRKGSLYTLQYEQVAFLTQQSAIQGCNITTWHRRLAHVNLSDIGKLVGGMAIGIELTDPKTDYVIVEAAS